MKNENAPSNNTIYIEEGGSLEKEEILRFIEERILELQFDLMTCTEECKELEERIKRLKRALRILEKYL